MSKQILFFSLVLTLGISKATGQGLSKDKDYPKALVSYNDYERLTKKVKKIRAKRLISFNTLLKYQKDPNTVILDARSRDKFNAKHIQGAINLPYTEFTQENLRAIIPDVNTRIVIYCNNNFVGDPINFASKTFTPTNAKNENIDDKRILLALNVPTYITLYGYGYRNIYELDELVHIRDLRLMISASPLTHPIKNSGIQDLIPDVWYDSKKN